MLFVVSIENLKICISYLLGKTLALSINCNKYKIEDEKIFKEKESVDILKILGLINNTEEYKIWNKKSGKYKITPEENMNQEFRLKKIDESIN